MSGTIRTDEASRTDIVTLRSSSSGIGFAVLGLLCLVALTVAVLASSGLGGVAIGLLVVTIGSTLVVGYDMPISTAVDAEGIERRTPLRRHRILWDDIDRLQRMRRGSLLPRVRSKGIVAMRGPRQVLLCDRTESQRQHDAMRRIVGPDLAEFYFEGLGRPGTS